MLLHVGTDDDPQKLVEGWTSPPRLILLHHDRASEVANSPFEEVIRLPRGSSSQISPHRAGVLLATLMGMVEVEESIAVVSILPPPHPEVVVALTSPCREFQGLALSAYDLDTPSRRRIARLLLIALELSEGKEGHPIGTTIVQRNRDDLEPFLRQMILNPCAGHAPENRMVGDTRFLDTLRELASLDGALLVAPNGVLDSAGTYLDAPTVSESGQPGWGSRHLSAAALTGATDALAAVVSESTGSITILAGGRVIVNLSAQGRSPAARTVAPAELAPKTTRTASLKPPPRPRIIRPLSAPPRPSDSALP